MGRPAGWMTELTGRSAMRSPGAPSHRREVEREFWREIAKGLLPEEAAHVVGASQAVGSRWFRHGGGMSPFDLEAFSGRYLSFREREEIALLRAQGTGVREIARTLGRSPSTISRELRRNAATRGGKLEYRASVAQWKAELVARRPKDAKLVTNPLLHEYVQERLSGQIQRPDGTPITGPPTGPGPVGTSRTVRTAPGCRPGARSRSRTGSRSTSPMMSPCASATRRSIRRSTSRAAGRSSAS